MANGLVIGLPESETGLAENETGLPENPDGAFRFNCVKKHKITHMTNGKLPSGGIAAVSRAKMGFREAIRIFREASFVFREASFLGGRLQVRLP